MSARRSATSLGFPLLVLEPGARREVAAVLERPMKVTKLIIDGDWDVLRGSFWVKRARLPELDRDDVFAFSHWSPRPHLRTTTVAFTAVSGARVARVYRPDSVVYNHVGPLEYVRLIGCKVGDVNQFPATPEGIAAQFFGAGVLGNQVSLATATTTMTVELESSADVPIRVAVAALGMACG